MSAVAVGAVLAGKYRVDRILGEGGMGIVVAATHVQLDEPVAVKLLHASLVAEPDLVARFQREAKAARKIKSEHVVRILDVGELDDGVPFMVMEYLAGTDLDALLRARGPLTVPDAVDFLLQACEALAEAHVQGMVHRDLKPANLFVSKRADETPLLKVLDFGISKVTGRDGRELGVTKTSSGTLGSPLYMAPEQMRSLRDVDARTDIWSLGTILHELLAGAPPFQATTLTELCASILQDPPAPLRIVRPDVPPALEAVILRCLAKEPAGRYPDVAALAMDLHGYASAAGRNNAERIFGVYRAAGLPRGSKPSSTATAGSIESARTMAVDPTGPRLPPLAVITPRPMTKRLGVATTGKVWAGDSQPIPASTAGRPLDAVVIALVAIVAVLGTIVVIFVVMPRFKSAPAVSSEAPRSAPSTMPAATLVAAPAAPSASADPEPPAPSAVASSTATARPKPSRPAATKPQAKTSEDCKVPVYYDAQGKKHWKEECL